METHYGLFKFTFGAELLESMKKWEKPYYDEIVAKPELLKECQSGSYPWEYMIEVRVFIKPPFQFGKENNLSWISLDRLATTQALKEANTELIKSFINPLAYRPLELTSWHKTINGQRKENK